MHAGRRQADSPQHSRRDQRRRTWLVIRHLIGVRKDAYFIGGAMWIAVMSVPLGVGIVLERLFDAITMEGPALWWLAAVAGLEIGRAAAMPLLGWIFEPWWATSETVMRTNIMRAQLAAEPEERGPAVPDPAAALPLFREDPENLTRVVDFILNLVGLVIVAVIGLIVIARIGPVVAVAVAVPLLAACAVGYWLAPMVRRLRSADRAVTAEVTGVMGEVFGAVTTVTTSGASGAVLDRIAAVCERRKVTAVRDRVASELLPSLGSIAADLALAAALVAGAWVAVDGLSPGQVALLTSYAVLLSRVPRDWAAWIALRRHADVALERMTTALPGGDPASLILPIARPAFEPPPVPREPLGDRPPAPSLELDGLVVQAPDGRCIGPIDLRLDPGGMAVITGPVGSGKTTLLRAIVGSAPILAGEVRWDGRAVDVQRDMTPPRAAYVAQVPTLFSESLADNLRLGWDVADPVLGTALETAAADDLAAGLEQGLDTPLGAKGVRLSGGQGHRVATARAVVGDPALLVADDLSAALDASTEAGLLDRLLVQGARTLLVVSHRGAVLERADVVVDLGSPSAATAVTSGSART